MYSTSCRTLIGSCQLQAVLMKFVLAVIKALNCILDINVAMYSVANMLAEIGRLCFTTTSK